MAREGQRELPMDVDKEMLYRYSMDMLNDGVQADYFVYGHRHLPVQVNLNDSAQLIILGDWLANFTYAEFDGQKMTLKHFTNNH